LDRTSEPEFALQYDDINYRVTNITDVDGQAIFVLRRPTASLRPIEQVGLAPAIVSRLLRPALPGLIVVCGKTGAGKTSTAASLIKARMERYGGVAITVEDPPEVRLNGPHGPDGQGRCIQIEASRKHGGYP